MLRHGMSDTADDVEFNARHLLNKGKTHSLRKQMREFISEHDSTTDLKTLREEVATGKPISEIVTKDRDERL